MRADRFRDLRAEHAYSRKKLATLLGISESNIPRYENGTQLPSSDVLKKLAELFSVTTDYLVGLTDDPRASLREHEFTQDELRAISLFRATSSDNRQKILGVLEIMTDHHGDAGV
jgi:transcriptional regulator with XRE-family HTH domain